MQGRWKVHIDAQSRIIVTFDGKQTAATIRDLIVEIEKLIRENHLNGRKALVMYDARALKLSDATTGSRVEGKKLLSLPTDGNAIVMSRYLAPVVSYVMRMSLHPERSRAFRNKSDALHWLDKIRQPAVRRRTFVPWLVGVGLALLGLSVLVGWQWQNQHLMRWVTTQRPMNPLAAIGIIVLGLGLYATRSKNWKRVVQFVAALLILFGGLVLLPWHIDSLLFHAKIQAAGSHTDVADLAAGCFIASGLTLWLMLLKQRWARNVEYVLIGLIITTGLFNFYGLLYASHFMYQIGMNFTMALNLAAAFVIAGITLLFLQIEKEARHLLRLITRTGWLIVAVFILTQLSTYQSWSQAITRNNLYTSQAFDTRAGDVGDAVRLRLQAYTDALRGFRGLFAASSYVQQGEFQAYFNSLDLAKTYPGIRAVTFIARVDDASLPAFIALHRSDSSLYPKGNPAFAVVNKAPVKTHYIVTYNATSNSVTGLGSDLAGTASRAEAFRAAEASGNSVTSVPVTFNGTNGQPAQLGFFVTIPVYDEVSGKTPIGFVNAVFDYDSLLGTIFARNDLLQDLRLKITQDGQPIYSSNKDTSPQTLTSEIITPIADRSWQLTISTDSDFGLGASQRNLPKTLLTLGLTINLFIAIIFVMQIRSRRQTLALAESITEDLQYERNLAVNNDRKSTAILSSIGDAVFAVDLKGHVTLFNPAAERISGYSKEEAIGKPYSETLQFKLEKNDSPNHRFIQQALGGHAASMANHTVLIRKDGKRIPVADSAAPIHDAGGKTTGAIVVFRDVTTEYQLDKAKTEFVSLASHQLRTPLSAINWYSELLLGGEAGRVTKQQEEYLREIHEGNRRMVELVDALLDVSRLELGKLKNEPQPSSILDLAKSLEKELAANIKTGGVVFTSQLPATLPTIFADPKQLRMILQNLLSNAIKYTPKKGQVTLTIRTATTNEVQAAKLRAGSYCYIQVSDTGYGIPQAQQPKIFQKLFRADNVQALDVEGTGLGLYIVKEVVQGLGGTVWFESKEHQGTTFYVLLPFRKQPHKHQSERKQP